MDKQRQAEVIILYRVLYLLEEQSVSRLSRDDQHFNDIINNLYEQVSHQVAQLQIHTR